MKPLSVDVIICTRNRGDLIENTIGSLQASTWNDFQAYIIDQSTDQKTAQVVEPYCEKDARFHYIHTTSVGLDIARNVGIKTGDGDVIAYIDDDCWADPKWLENIMAEYEINDDVWAVFGRIIPGGRITTLQGSDSKLENALPMAKIEYPERRIYQHNRFNLGFGHGANMTVQRSTFQKVGLYDELLGAGGWLRSWPERDLGYRILKEGGKIVYTPHAIVHHYHWRGWPEVIKTNQNYAIGCGAAVGKYLRKGDLSAIFILLEWIWSQGVRQMFSGLFKWRSWKKFYIGWTQIIFPFVGLKMGKRYQLSNQFCIYLSPDEQTKN